MQSLRVVSVFWVFLVIAPINAYAAGLGGSWEGDVTEDDASTYRMEMNLYGNAGSISYPSLRCGGTLEFIKTDGTGFWYREHITSGKDACIDGGIIQIRPHALGGDTDWEWRWDGEGITARGVVRGSGAAESD